MNQIIVLIGVLLYFLPTLYANGEKKKHQEAIFIINGFFGWTIIGWFGALIWAMVAEKKTPPDDMAHRTAYRG